MFIGAAPNCGQNEYFNSCGSSCQPTCQNPTPGVCVLVSIAFFKEKRTLKNLLNNLVKYFIKFFYVEFL